MTAPFQKFEITSASARPVLSVLRGNLNPWSVDPDTTTGLTLGYVGGTALSAGGDAVLVPDGTVALADDATNYVERDEVGGEVSVNQVGFTRSGTMVPMFVVTTAAGAISGTSLADWRPMWTPPVYPAELIDGTYVTNPRHPVCDAARYGAADGEPSDEGVNAAITVAYAIGQREVTVPAGEPELYDTIRMEAGKIGFVQKGKRTTRFKAVEPVQMMVVGNLDSNSGSIDLGRFGLNGNGIATGGLLVQRVNLSDYLKSIEIIDVQGYGARFYGVQDLTFDGLDVRKCGNYSDLIPAGVLVERGVEAAPTTAPTVALASPDAPGNLSAGEYRYRVTFVSDMDESNGGTISSAVTVVAPGVNGKVELTAIPVGAGTNVLLRRIYRTTAGGSTYKLLTTLGDNTTTIYTDNIPDAALGAELGTASPLYTNTLTFIGGDFERNRGHQIAIVDSAIIKAIGTKAHGRTLKDDPALSGYPQAYNLWHILGAKRTELVGGQYTHARNRAVYLDSYIRGDGTEVSGTLQVIGGLIGGTANYSQDTLSAELRTSEAWNFELVKGDAQIEAPQYFSSGLSDDTDDDDPNHASYTTRGGNVLVQLGFGRLTGSPGMEKSPAGTNLRDLRSAPTRAQALHGLNLVTPGTFQTMLSVRRSTDTDSGVELTDRAVRLGSGTATPDASIIRVAADRLGPGTGDWLNSGLKLVATRAALAASLTDNATLPSGTSVGWRAERAGSVAAIGLTLSASQTAGTLTVRIQKSSDHGVSWADIDSTNCRYQQTSGRGGQAVLATGSYAFAAGDLLRFTVTTTGTFAPAGSASADLSAVVFY